MALLTHGSAATLDAGYAASAAANPAGVWQPRYVPQGTDPHGGSDTYSGNWQYNADPEFAWSNGFTPFAVVNGDLRIRAQPTAGLGFQAGEVPTDPASGQTYAWMSGLLTTKSRFQQQGGCVSMVAQMPHGQGTWPAFWQMPTNEVHPPELDVNEYVSQSAVTTYQANAISLGAVQHPEQITASVDLSQGMHNYAECVTDTTDTRYLDNVQMGSLDISGLPEFQEPFYLLLNNQVGSRLSGWVPAPDSTTPNPDDMLIQSVTAWQRTGVIGLALSASSYLDTTPVNGTVATMTGVHFGASSGDTYSIVSDPDSMFQVSGNALQLRQVVPASTKASHQVTLQDTDGQGNTFKELFTFTVVAGNTNPNLLPTSDLTNGAWTKENATASAADVLLETAANAGHDVILASPVSKPASGTRYTFTVNATPNLSDGWVQIQVFASNGGQTDYSTDANAWFNVQAGTVGYTSTSGGWGNLAATVTPVGGAQQLQVTFTTAGENGLVPLIRLAHGQDQASYAGNTGDGMTLDAISLQVVQ